MHELHQHVKPARTANDLLVQAPLTAAAQRHVTQTRSVQERTGRLFGTDGVRGVVNDDLTPELAHAPFTYVLLAHNHPAAVVRLARAILTEVPQSRIVVHYSALSGPFPDCSDERIIAVEHPAAVQWATFSQTDMMLRSLEQIRRSGLPNSWIVMLSGQSYPVRPLRAFEQMLSSCGADAYLWFRRIERSERDLFERYSFHYVPVGNGPLPFPFNVRCVRGVVNRMQPLVRVKSNPRAAFVGYRARRSIFDVVPNVYYGTQWLALSGKAADYITGAIHERPDLLDLYRRTSCAEESFFPTVLQNAPDLRTLNDDVHYTDWSTIRTGSPRSLLMKDLAAIERSDKWFARKIDPGADDGLRDALDAVRARRATGDAFLAPVTMRAPYNAGSLRVGALRY